MRTPFSRIADLWIALATALTILALTIPLFLNPVWVGFEQGRAGAAAWTGYSDVDLERATDAILSDLVFGPPHFDVAVAGAPVLEEREQAHMRDVRDVFIGFFAIAAVAAAGAVALALARRADARLATWRAIRAGAVGLIAGLVIAGAVAVLAFDALFEAFHRLLFAGGSYTFDPGTDHLVQLFPFQFWQETAIVVGAVAIVAALIVAVIAQRRLATPPIPQSSPAGLEGSRP